MAKKKETENLKERWITAEEAATILSKNSGHPVTAAYVRRLGNPNGLAKLTSVPVGKRVRMYNRAEVEAYYVQPRGDGSVRRAVRKPKTAERKDLESAIA